jgi:DNA (cytosine-5)-methyltransferase 1
MTCDSGASVYEFFAGGGLARLGLAPHWRVAFANDIDPTKAAAYRRAFPNAPLREGDIWDLQAHDLPGRAGLAWASFPCQDLSLAGARGGLEAPRSGAFWGFWRLIKQLKDAGRAPPILVLENVSGLLSSNAGADFAALGEALAELGYHFGAVEIDASWFVPQSRPRVFIVAALQRPPPGLIASERHMPFHSPAMARAVDRLAQTAAQKWVWWRLPAPPRRNIDLAALIETNPSACWNSAEKTDRLLAMMSNAQRARIDALQAQGASAVGALFKRVRVENGAKVQRAEARFDGLAGCMRTPTGGSSRQTLVVIEQGHVRTRLISAREGARLMGVPDDYPLPASQNAALQLIGDGVAVPVVRWLNENLLTPLARAEVERARQ